MGRRLTTVACLFLLTAACRGQEEADPRDGRCANNLGNIIKCCHLYSDATPNDGKFPPKLEDLIGPYLRDVRVLSCPRTEKHTPGKGTVAVCDYIYLPGSTPVDATRIVAFCPKQNHGGKYIYTIGAGSVEVADEAKFRKLLKETIAELKIDLNLPKPSEGPLPDEQRKALTGKLNGLASEDFDTRDAAGRALAKAGESARPVLEEGAKNADPEVASRCQHLLAELARGRVEFDKIVMLRGILGLETPAEGTAPKAKE